MTKLKSKKMTKSTFAIIIMAIAMVAMLAFGGTYAYFTASSNQAASDETTKTAIVALSDAEVAVELKDSKTSVLPGDTVDVNATVTNTSNRSIYAFVKLEVELPESATAENISLDFSASITGTNGTTWTQYKNADGSAVAGVYYMLIASGDAEFSVSGVFQADEESVEGAIENTIMDKPLVVVARFAATQSENIVVPDEAEEGTTAVNVAYELVADALTITASDAE